MIKHTSALVQAWIVVFKLTLHTVLSGKQVELSLSTIIAFSGRLTFKVLQNHNRNRWPIHLPTETWCLDRQMWRFQFLNASFMIYLSWNSNFEYTLMMKSDFAIFAAIQARNVGPKSVSTLLPLACYFSLTPQML